MIEYYIGGGLREWLEFPAPEWWMVKDKGNSYYRHIRTVQEHKENSFAAIDKNYYGYKVRGKRLGSLPNPWDDYKVGKTSFKSWKALSKNKKQWGKKKTHKRIRNIK